MKNLNPNQPCGAVEKIDDKGYLSEFCASLANDSTDSTANSYKSGMTQLINWYNKDVVEEVKGNVKNFPGFFDSLEQINDEDIVNTFFSFVRVQLQKKIMASSRQPILPKKHYTIGYHI